MRKLTIVPLIAIAALLAIPALASSASAATITIGDNFFSPSSKTVGVGTKVSFDWTGKKKHNVFKKSGPRRRLPLGHDQEQGRQLRQDLQQGRRLQADLHRPPEGNAADARRSTAERLDQHAEVEPRRRVRQGADRDQLDPGLGDLADALKVDPARGLEGGSVAVAGLASRSADRLAEGVGGHVVEQEPVGPGGERRRDLVEIAALDLDREVGVGGARGADRLREAAGEGDVVLLDQDRVEEAERGG